MDARNWNRHLVEKQVACRIEGAARTAFLYDLCQGGCMIELDDASAVLGLGIVIELDGRASARGQVVWQVGSCAGVRFEAPIHEALVRLVGFVPPVISFEEQAPRDRFGRVLPPLKAVEQGRLGW